MSQNKSILGVPLDPFVDSIGSTEHIQSFQNLMRYRIRDVLLGSSLYDLYVFEEDGHLYELIRDEYKGLNLSHAPEITRVSSGKQALKMLRDDHRFDLIITTQHVEDMSAVELSRRIHKKGLQIPIVLLAYDDRELLDICKHSSEDCFDGTFIWTGDYRLIIAIIKLLEDLKNVEHDTQAIGVQTIILVEDDVRFYSSFLPLLYTEILKQSQRLIEEGINLSDKYLRMRARPKILLATSYEQAWKYFKKYEDLVLGVISDIDFLRNGKHDPEAGIKFARNIKKRHGDIPVLLQSTRAENKEKAEKAGATFILKDSPNLLQQLREFTNDKFSFGDFVFRLPDGTEVGRAENLHRLKKLLQIVPAESIQYHAERNHFSNWLKARTEFALAHELRPRKVSDYESLEALRQDLVSRLRLYRKARQQGIITDFRRESFNPHQDLARVGGGSMGGKARGLSFVKALLNNFKLNERFPGINIQVPPGIILGTEVFDEFLDKNNLRNYALNATDDRELVENFLKAPYFPGEVGLQLLGFLELVNTPLAVRSSSVLEDSQYHPFAGVYETYMIPNNHPDIHVRLRQLENAIKRVYASTFFQATKEYIRLTSYRLEEEKMAVIIQKLVGAKHGTRFYPTFSGVAKSYNFYPVPPQKPDDGIATVALGLGKMVVDGGATVKFSPRYPRHLLQFSSVKAVLKNSQHKFYALDFTQDPNGECIAEDLCVRLFPLKEAEKDGCLYHVGSTYSHENDMIYDGLSRPGARIVTFAPILKHKVFPLPEILELLLQIGKWGMGTPVEIEFAVNMAVAPDQPKEFGVVQIRPMVLKREMEDLKFDVKDRSQLLCESNNVLGHGVINDIKDIVYVNIHTYDRSRSVLVAEEVAQLDSKLKKQRRPYLLIGVGRWGSLDPWLGIPVRWEQISGARVIVETSFKDFVVQPSQGSHFFHNLTSFMVGYFTIAPFDKESFMDWDWLLKQPVTEQLKYTSHVRLSHPLTIEINGHDNYGIILKPQSS